MTTDRLSTKTICYDSAATPEWQSMNSLAGYIATFCVSVAVFYVSLLLQFKIKIRYWFSHNFLYTMPWNPPQQSQQALPPATTQQSAVTAAVQPAPPTGSANLLTRSITVQNFGRKSAEWVEIVHRRKPDFFQFYPSLNYTESTTLAGEHVLRVNSLAHREWFTIQFLSYSHEPELLYVRSTAGHASLMPWMVVRKYPQWVIAILWMLILIGSGFCAYWLIRASVFLFELMRGQ
jgi:hypothetical protein